MTVHEKIFQFYDRSSSYKPEQQHNDHDADFQFYDRSSQMFLCQDQGVLLLVTFNSMIDLPGDKL